MKEAMGVLTYYEKLYTQKYGKKPVVNRYREKWGAADVVDSVDYLNAKALLDYYFTLDGNHKNSLPFFLQNFDKLAVARDARLEDDRRTRELLEKTKELVETEGVNVDGD